MINKLCILFLVLILLVSVPVFAAGSSTRSADTSSAPTTVNTQKSDTNQSNETNSSNPETLEECEEFNERRERIKCRLQVLRERGEDYVEQYNERSQRYEACERLANVIDVEITSKEECRDLYAKVRPCYDLQGKEKLICFKRYNGLLNKYFREAEKKDIRNYIVTLLYELQERIENALEEGKIKDEDKAAEVIDKIVEIKEDIMNGETRDIVKPKIIELKVLMKEVKNE